MNNFAESRTLQVNTLISFTSLSSRSSIPRKWSLSRLDEALVRLICRGESLLIRLVEANENLIDSGLISALWDYSLTTGEFLDFFRPFQGQAVLV